MKSKVLVALFINYGLHSGNATPIDLKVFGNHKSKNDYLTKHNFELFRKYGTDEIWIHSHNQNKQVEISYENIL